MVSTHHHENNYATAAPLKTRIGLHQQFSINPYGWFRWLLDHIDLKPGLSIAELGCGTGLLWSAVEPTQLDGVQLHLYDKSPAMVEAAQRELHRVATARFDTIDLDVKFSLPPSVDIVLANHVLYHCKDPNATLQRIKALTHDTTRCIFASNGERSMWSLNRFLPERFWDAPMSKLISGFTLESGYQHTKNVFGSAHTYRYADGLHIVETAPLISYIESLPWEISSSEMDFISSSIEEHIQLNGSIYIEKDTGFLSNFSSAEMPSNN